MYKELTNDMSMQELYLHLDCYGELALRELMRVRDRVGISARRVIGWRTLLELRYESVTSDMSLAE